MKTCIKKSKSLWPKNLLDSVGLLKSRLYHLEIRILAGEKLDLITEFKRAIKLIESI